MTGRKRRDAEFPWEQCYTVDVASGCWKWANFIDRNGYGRAWFDGKKQSAHRVFYILYKGKIPDGLTIDHLCRNRACVNPDHLEAVTHHENVLRGAATVLHDECVRGHKFTPENTYYRKGKPGRICRQCALERAALIRRQKGVPLSPDRIGETHRRTRIPAKSPDIAMKESLKGK